ncbi:MAG: Wzz/FepE/Etk N-terminal domain-containing protein [bacterium]
MNYDKKELIQNDEIDLVELFGVLIKRRKFMIYFILIATFIGSLLLLFMEYRHSVLVEKNYKLENSMSANRDAVFASYMFVKKGLEKDHYNKFLSSILFPSTVDAPDFEIVDKKGYVDVIYLFHDEESSKLFMNKYNALVYTMGKLVNYGASLDEKSFSNCRQFNTMSVGNIDKEISMLFKNSEEIKNCNMFNYYYAMIQSKITYALDSTTVTTVPEAYIPFITDFMKSGVEKSLLKTTLKTEENKNDIKITAKSNFSKKKVFKYTFLIFILSGIISIFIVFVFEFLHNNKSRLSKYWSTKK